MAKPDYDRLDSIYNAALSRRLKRADIRRREPEVFIYDGDWQLVARCLGFYEASFEWKLNGVGGGQLVLPYEHHLAKWIIEHWRRKKQNVHVRVDKDGARWTGRLSDAVTEQDENGVRLVTLNFLHDMEELRHIQVWSNPLTPSAVQFPKQFILAGPSVYTLKLSLFLNLFRLQGNLWSLPDDPLDPKSWLQGLNYKEWPIVVKPSSLLLDDSKWTVLVSRFKNWLDMAETTLGDGQLMVECRRWFPGDEQPWLGAGLYRPGQLVIDIVDKSGWFGETAIGGTIAGGFIRSFLEVADNLVDETRAALEFVSEPEQYAVSGFLGVAPQKPWIAYRTNVRDGQNTAESTSFTWQPATVGQVTVGGHSMPGVNEGISASVKLAGALASQFFFIPDFGGAADALLAPLYEDVFLAFQTVKSPLRTRQLGWSHYYENFASGGDKAYTLSSLLAIRAEFWRTRQRVSHSMQIGDAAPYLIGENGQGHFFLGDRVGGEVPGAPDGYTVVEQVKELKLAWGADAPHEWEITVGDPNDVEDPVEHALERIREVTGAIHDLGVI